MDPDNSPSLRNKRPRDETDKVEDEAADDEPSGNENDDAGEDSGGESGEESGESLAETPAAHGGPGMTLARATEPQELVLQSRALSGGSGAGCAGMGGLNEYLNLGGVEAAEPEQEARKATAVYARSFLECAEPPTCVDFADEEERRFRFIPFETKFTDDAARGPR